MVRHFRHRHALGQSERQWLDIEVTGRLAGRAFDLKEFPIPGEIAESHRPRWWWRSATTLGLIPLLLQLDKLRQPDDQAGEFLGLAIGQPLVRDGDGVRWLPVHMSQRQAIGIDDTIAAWDRLESPWSRKPAPGHRANIRCAGFDGP
jgi:hypothetical protein